MEIKEILEITTRHFCPGCKKSVSSKLGVKFGKSYWHTECWQKRFENEEGISSRI